MNFLIGFLTVGLILFMVPWTGYLLINLMEILEEVDYSKPIFGNLKFILNYLKTKLSLNSFSQNFEDSVFVGVIFYLILFSLISLTGIIGSVILNII